MSRTIFGRGDIQPPVRGLDPDDLLGNGRLATVQACNQIAQYVNQISATRRRVLAQWSVRPGDMVGSSGTTSWSTIQYFRIRPSYQVARVRAVIVALPSDSISAAATPGLRFARQDLDGPGLVNFYRAMNIGRRDTGTLAPDDYFVLEQTLGPSTNTSGTDEIVAGGVYDMYLQGRGGARVLSVTLFEESGRLYVDNPSDSGDGDAFTFNGPYTQLVDASASFNTSILGAPITITGATSAGNNGTFHIFRVTNSTTIEYRNTTGVTETFAAGTRYRIRAPSLNVGRSGSPILDDDIDRMLQIPYGIWKDGGGHLFSWSNYQNPKARISLAGANIHDQTITAWSATAPGHWVWPYKQGSYEDARCPVVMWAYAIGGTTGAVYFHANGVLMGNIGIGSSIGMYTATGYLDTTQDSALVTVGFRGDGVTAATVFSYGMYQYEP